MTPTMMSLDPAVFFQAWGAPIFLSPHAWLSSGSSLGSRVSGGAIGVGSFVAPPPPPPPPSPGGQGKGGLPPPPPSPGGHGKGNFPSWGGGKGKGHGKGHSLSSSS